MRSHPLELERNTELRWFHLKFIMLAEETRSSAITEIAHDADGVDSSVDEP